MTTPESGSRSGCVWSQPALERLAEVTAGAPETEILASVRKELSAYRESASSIIQDARDREALLRYHGEANPLLRRVVGSAGEIRHPREHFVSPMACQDRDGLGRWAAALRSVAAEWAVGP